MKQIIILHHEKILQLLIKDDIYVFGGLNTVDGGLIMGDQIFGYFSYDFEKNLDFQVIPLILIFQMHLNHVMVIL